MKTSRDEYDIHKNSTKGKGDECARDEGPPTAPKNLEMDNSLLCRLISDWTKNIQEQWHNTSSVNLATMPVGFVSVKWRLDCEDRNAKILRKQMTDNIRLEYCLTYFFCSIADLLNHISLESISWNCLYVGPLYYLKQFFIELRYLAYEKCKKKS